MIWIGHNSWEISPIDAINAFIQKDNHRVAEHRFRNIQIVESVDILADWTFQADFWEWIFVTFQVKEWVAEILSATHNPTFIAA